MLLNHSYFILVQFLYCITLAHVADSHAEQILNIWYLDLIFHFIYSIVYQSLFQGFTRCP